ncbi:hypothetical protein [Streptomyces sp. NPDC088358]|uniref:hypothetical protein n=1 Tax=Streptomyces sp. NPDC088358 TaxID=3365857 RepID=UPI00380EA1D0
MRAHWAELPAGAEEFVLDDATVAEVAEALGSAAPTFQPHSHFLQLARRDGDPLPDRVFATVHEETSGESGGWFGGSKPTPAPDAPSEVVMRGPRRTGRPSGVRAGRTALSQ